MLKTVLLFFQLSLVAQACLAQAPLVFAYVAGYRGNTIDVSRIEAARLTHILYAFANCRNNKAVLNYPRTDDKNLKAIIQLKGTHKHLKVLLSVGGLGWSRGFSAMAATAAGRLSFAKSCKVLLERYKLDGIDIDWEFPGYAGEGGNPYRPEDKQNYTLLFKDLREILGDKAIISTAVDGWASHYVPHTEMDKVALYADYILLMTYNFNSNGIAGGHFLFSPPGFDPGGSVDGAVKGFMAAGVPKAKLVAGAGFFPAALLMKTDDPRDNSFVKKLPFRGGLARVKQLAKQSSYQRVWDSVGKAPYLFNKPTRIRIAYEDAASVDTKWKYVKDQGLAGLMYWDYFSDPGRELLHRLIR